MMEKRIVEYTINCATEKKVYEHLVTCDENFMPPISLRINIREYASKITAHAVTFEAWQNDVLVGLIAVYANNLTGSTAFITNVSVVKDHMGNGIASELMEKLISYVAEKGFTDIGLEVNKTNQQAIYFYGKFNFEQDSTKDDLLIMKKRIH